ncbi:MAG: Holliday junction branch migration protein RuvA [Spirosomataceae bacterium]
MIAFLEGKLAQKDPTHAIIQAGGVGYFVKISLQTFSQLPEIGSTPVLLHTMLIVREDSHTLFGFSDLDERRLFEDLISVSGIGPSIAMVMLSSLSTHEIRQAIIQEDVKTVQSIKGIGVKTAQRAIIELKDKLRKENALGGGTTGMPLVQIAPNQVVQQEALAALVTLGIPKATAEKSIDMILKRTGTDITVEELIKLALR